MMNRWQQGSAGEGPRAKFGAQGNGGPGDGKNLWKKTSPEGALQGSCLSSYFGKIQVVKSSEAFIMVHLLV